MLGAFSSAIRGDNRLRRAIGILFLSLVIITDPTAEFSLSTLGTRVLVA